MTKQSFVTRRNRLSFQPRYDTPVVMAAESDDSPFGRAVLITLAVLVLYVLSIGPVYRELSWKGRNFEDYPWLVAVYFPIVWTYHHCEPARDAIKWYLRRWSNY